MINFTARLMAPLLACACALVLAGCAGLAAQAALSMASPELFASMFGNYETRVEFKEAAPLMQKKDWLGLTVLARQKLAVDPRRGSWWEIAGYGHMELGELVEARDCFERATRLMPEEVDAWNLYAYALKSMKDGRRALEAANRAIEIDPYSGTAYVIIGELQREAGLLTPARKAYERAIEIDDSDVFAWYGLGLVGKRSRDPALYEKAKNALQKIYKPMAEQLEKEKA